MLRCISRDNIPCSFASRHGRASTGHSEAAPERERIHSGSGSALTRFGSVCGFGASQKRDLQMRARTKEVNLVLEEGKRNERWSAIEWLS